SFADLLRGSEQGAPSASTPAPQPISVPHGTTVLAMKYAHGAVMAGDRRATEGYSIADERIDKVFPADEMSAVAIAGAAGQATEIVRLFQTELEHYEKVEGERLSLEGKANRLGQMIRGNFPMALQGLVVVEDAVRAAFESVIGANVEGSRDRGGSAAREVGDEGP